MIRYYVALSTLVLSAAPTPQSLTSELPLHFEAAPPDSGALYWARGGGVGINIERSGIVVTARGSRPVRMRLEGGTGKATVEPADRLPGVSNYYHGNDPGRWRVGVPHYAKVRAKGVYRGIDLVCYGKGRRLEYDFVVAPGVDPDRIQLAYEGVDAITVDDGGDLLLKVGDQELRQHKPVVYQEAGGRRVEVAGRYRIRNSRVGFELARYDRSRPLVIDPVLTYATYLGGGSGDNGKAIAVDSAGNIIAAGSTDSSNFPMQAPADSAFGGREAFVTKIGAAGNVLVYSTYLGGTSGDEGHALALDSSGAAYVGGFTNSTDFPVLTPFQATSGGGGDGFLAKLSPTGALTFATYIGGNSYDTVLGLAIDSTGVYLTGDAGSGDFPGARGGAGAFVTKFNLAGSTQIYCRTVPYSGGFSPSGAAGVAVDSSGAAYIAGTAYPGLATTAGVVQPAYAGGTDAFAAKLNPAGTAWSYITYFGGNDNDSATGIAVDGAGRAHVAGRTYSANFPTAATPATALAGYQDGFVAVLNPTASAFVFSTYIGGAEFDQATSVAVGSGGSVYVGGYTWSIDFPTEAAFQAARAGYFDGFLVKFSSTGGSPLYSTFYGGADGDSINAIVIDASGAVYTTGGASPALPMAGTSFDQSANGSYDAFVAKFIDGPPPVPVTIASSPPGFKVKVDGRIITTPVTQNWVPGTQHALDANSPHLDNGNVYRFSSWSDGGSAAHTVPGPAGPTTYTVTYTAAACAYSLSTPILAVDFLGGRVTVNIVTHDECNWSLPVHPPWITLDSGGPLTGPGSLSFRVSPNLGAPRSAALAIGSATLTVNQGGSSGSLAAPTVTAPVSGQTIQTRGGNIAWNPVPGASGYEIRGASDGTSSPYVLQLVHVSQHLGNAASARLDLPNGGYSVFVRACGATFTDAACGPYSRVNLTVSLLASTQGPVVLTPARDQTVTGSTFQFTWEPVPGAIFYEVGLYDVVRDRQEMTIATPFTNTIHTMPSSQAYVVLVKACQVACFPNPQYSVAGTSFRTQLPSIPASPPTGIAVNVTGGNVANISWNAVAGAHLYRVQVIQPNTGPGGGALTVAAQQLSATSIAIPVPSGPASVIVAACNGDGCSPYSGGVPINPAGPNPSAPIIGSPMAGIKVDGPAVTFAWTRIPGDNGSNTQYRLYVGDLSTGDPVLDVLTNNNFYGANLRAEARRYDALVIAKQGGVTTQGPTQGFLVGGASATAPTVSSPTHGSTVSAGITTLKWSPVPNSARYQFAVVRQGVGTALTVASGMTPGLFIDVALGVGVHTALVRACPTANANANQCQVDSDAGWGPWSNVAGASTQFTVVP
jgi:hypothetical protein